jgi:hypothetical protein
MSASGISRRNALAGLVAAATGSALAAQDPAKVQPRSYRVVFENSEVRVLEYSSVPGMGVCGAGLHSHPRSLNIALTPSRVRVSVNGNAFVATNKEGDVWYTPPVTHEAENISGHGVRALMVEFKTPPPRA